MNIDAFWARVAENENGCWEWQGSRRNAGYGTVYVSPGHTMGAHRYAWILMRGEIPAGLQLDHLCRNPPCVNPDHLDPVTPQENVRRALPSACTNGHPFDSAHIRLDGRGIRVCRTCKNDLQRERRRRQAVDNPGPGSGSYQASKTHCPQGHVYDASNTYVTKKGSRMCRECSRERSRKRRGADVKAATPDVTEADLAQQEIGGEQ